MNLADQFCLAVSDNPPAHPDDFIILANSIDTRAIFDCTDLHLTILFSDQSTIEVHADHLTRGTRTLH